MNFIGSDLFTKLFYGLIFRQMPFTQVLPLGKQGRSSTVSPDLSATNPARHSWVECTGVPGNTWAG